MKTARRIILGLQTPRSTSGNNRTTSTLDQEVIQHGQDTLRDRAIPPKARRTHLALCPKHDTCPKLSFLANADHAILRLAHHRFLPTMNLALQCQLAHPAYICRLLCLLRNRYQYRKARSESSRRDQSQLDGGLTTFFRLLEFSYRHFSPPFTIGETRVCGRR